ncbi:MAG TPA: glycosyltransferase [Chthoniobacterales bacterium]
MSVWVVINNYNYGRFLADALQSVLAQTRFPDRICVVDDGSTDDSRQLLRKEFKDRVEVVEKPNGGQLSCFNEIAGRVGENDVIFFLDADDRFRPGHLEKCLAVYEQHPQVDFVFTRHQRFGEESGPGVILCDPLKGDLGFSVFSARNELVWRGGPTSTLSLRGRILRRFLPCPLENDWRVRADDVLVFGSSLAGARKYFLDQPTVDYRVHASNHFHNRSSALEDSFAYVLRRERLLAWLETHLGMPFRREAILIAIEYKCLPGGKAAEFWRYLKMVAVCRSPLPEKGRALLSLLKSLAAGGA